MSKPTRIFHIWKYTQNEIADSKDELVVEEPLEIRVGYSVGRVRRVSPLSVTMRTPGEDKSLAMGFLFTEGIIQSAAQVEKIDFVKTRKSTARGNVIQVNLHPETSFDIKKLKRHFYTSSSCGVCGKSSIEAVWAANPPRLAPKTPRSSSTILHSLPEQLRRAQPVFQHTGGLHAAGLFSKEGKLLRLCEDVGRHNAVDKLVGSCLADGQLPLQDNILVLSGRAGFELVQKALMAGVPIVVAVGAPSSLAVQLARDADMTLLGFVRMGRFNVYSDADRIKNNK